jgi:hypothetical protein
MDLKGYKLTSTVTEGFSKYLGSIQGQSVHRLITERPAHTSGTLKREALETGGISGQREKQQDQDLRKIPLITNNYMEQRPS